MAWDCVSLSRWLEGGKRKYCGDDGSVEGYQEHGDQNGGENKDRLG